jgi:hypothetical protein
MPEGVALCEVFAIAMVASDKIATMLLGVPLLYLVHVAGQVVREGQPGRPQECVEPLPQCQQNSRV